MYCLYLKKRTNIVFWYSQKGACTYVKGLYLRYLGLNILWPHLLPQEGLERTDMPFNGEVESPIHVLFIRNPYKRIVSGFLDKLTWKPDFPDNKPLPNLNYGVDSEWSFEDFVTNLSEHPVFNDNHFTPQLSKAYDPAIQFDKIFDIENIDREYLNNLFQTTAEEPEHQGYFSMYKPYNGEKPAYKLTINEINKLDYKPEYHEFYSPEIKSKVAEIFADDFQYFKSVGFNYDA